MYGGSKLGRGGGRAGGGNKRNSFPPPPPPHRTSTPSSSNRLSMGSSASRNRTSVGPSSGGTSAGGRSKSVEETFSLVPGNNPLAFAMMIRLAPDLVEEIKRVESQGGTARIKFDSTANNPNGNVIDVGGKEFRFTWSREYGDLCDIYEERQSGEDGNGLLVESGCAWRKVNVQRILDESTTKHVKMLSKEAELKAKQRKAIVLDHGSPSVKNLKQLAAVESNAWKTSFKQKKEPPIKKRKVETLQVSGPPKSTIKSGVASTTPLKSRLSASPLPSPPLLSPPGQSCTPVSPAEIGNIVKSHVNIEEITPIQVKSKENASKSDKETPTRTTSAVQETPGCKGNSGAKPLDLQSMLISLLMENSKGMSLKALEKAVGDRIPNSARKIEPIIKKIATLQAPGRYFLKPAVELDSFKKPSSESGSSPEDNHHQTPAPEDITGKTLAPRPSFVGKVPTDEIKDQTQLNSRLGEESVASEKIDSQQCSPDLIGEKKAFDNIEGQVGSSSDSGSDSDSESDSSDSGSDSGSHSRSKSRSRSRSPVRSGSGSSSDSESDASPNNSKQGSDEDVDIMTSDDEKESKHKLQVSEPGLSASPDARPVQIEIDAKQGDDGSDEVDIEGDGSDAIDIEGHGSDAVDIEKDLLDDEKDTEMAENTSPVPSEVAGKPLEGVKPLTEHDEFQERLNFIGNLFDDKETTVKDSFRHEQSDSSERTSKKKSKRGSDSKLGDERSEFSKRSKVESSSRPPISGGRDAQVQESPRILSPNRYIEDPYKGPASQIINRVDREGKADFGSQKGYNQAFTGKSSSDSQQSARKPSDLSARSKDHDKAERQHKHGRKSSEKSSQLYEGFPPPREKASRDAPNEDSFMKEKRGPRNLKEGGAGAKNSAPFDSSYGKHGEMVGRFNETGQVSSSHMGNGRGSILQRELSDLELGELREPLPEATPSKKLFERRGSFKQSENKSSTSENCISDLSKGKPVGKAPLDPGKPSPPTLSVGPRRTAEHHVEVEDSTRTHNRVVQSQPQYLSRADNAEVGSQFNKPMDSSKSRQIEAGARLGGGLEGYGESHKKAHASAPQPHEPKRGLVSHTVKEIKAQPLSNAMPDLVGGRKDSNLTENNGSCRKRKESSSDEDTCSYSKYEKDEPELKEPIKDFSQYKEYLHEYNDKYDRYLSLNKVLDNYRTKFHKLGKDLEITKDRDTGRYYKIVEQLKDSYLQCGAKHKRMKKIFLVLHEELKHLKQKIKDFAVPYTKGKIED